MLNSTLENEVSNLKSNMIIEEQNKQIYIDNIVSRFNLGSMFFGIIANFLCITVYCHRKQLQTRFQIYLLAVAITDFCFCIIIFLNYLIYVVDTPNVLYDYSYLTCYFTDYIVGCLTAFSTLMTLILSFDRFVAVKNPLMLKSRLTQTHPKLIIFFSAAWTFIIKSPETFLSQRQYIMENTTYDAASNGINYPLLFGIVKFDIKYQLSKQY